ncbi:MAG: flagellar basal body-associated FliL family protein [Rhodomicrobiaceae bacterium]
MAKADTAVAATPKANGGISILGLLILSVMAAGSGVLFGSMVPGLIEQKPVKENLAAREVAGVPAGASLEPLGPITTNLAQPATTWIRLEAILVVEKPLGTDAEIIKKEIAEDLLGYLRTLSIDQISGASGFHHLKEDLNDRVRIRSEGKVSGVVVTSMILE